MAAHHGSLAKERRLDAEQRLKAGALKALVATASLELGIDIGEVDLVCQLGSPRSIAAFLQRVGRSGHAVDGTPKGRLFPLSRDELVECAALLDSVARGELDRVRIPEQPRDVLAQQIVAEVAAQEWGEDELYALFRRAWPYRALPRAEFAAAVQMLADGFSTRRGRRGALLHHDAVNRMLRGRRGARLTALTSGGTIPDTADYQVVLEPENQIIGTVNEDFAVESLAGDVFQLGNTAYRIRRVERGTMRVEDAEGQPPNIPFWLGEAPGRSDELSQAVSRLRQDLEARLSPSPAPRERMASPQGEPGEGGYAAALDRPLTPTLSPDGGEGVLGWLTDIVGIGEAAARQLVDYLAAGHAALGVLPTRERIVFERFFDAVGGMQLVIHSPYGSRLNRAWGLALRKRFCRKFNFELQAAATEDNIVLSLTTAHSFDLAEVAHYLHPATVRDVLIQALLDAPMFMTRWRWVAGVALALPRFRGGKKVPPPLARMDAEDLIAAIFPDQLACAENLTGAREIPDHPLVAQTIADCLNEVMDVDGLERLLARLHSGEIRVVARDLTEPSPLALEVLSARPYAYLDDAPLEERRTQAVMGRRWLAPEDAAELGRLDAQAIARVQGEAWPEAANRDEVHDALAWLGFVTPQEAEAGAGWSEFLGELVAEKRATLLEIPERGSPEAHLRDTIPAKAGTHSSTATAIAAMDPGLRRVGGGVWVAAERLPQFAALWPAARLDPPIAAPPGYAERDWSPEEALVEILRGRLEGLGPVSEAALAAPLGLTPEAIAAALIALQGEGFALRGRFTPGRRCRGMVRAPAARSHPSLYAGPAARRDRAGRGARLPALPCRLAARHREDPHGRPRCARRGARPARRVRGAGRRLGDRDPAGARRRIRSGLARRPLPRRADRLDPAAPAPSAAGCRRARASARSARCGRPRSPCWRAATGRSGPRCRRCPISPRRARAPRPSPALSPTTAPRSSTSWSTAPGCCGRRSRRGSPSWWRWASSIPTASPGCARCCCRPSGAAAAAERRVGAVPSSAWRMPAAGPWRAAPGRPRTPGEAVEHLARTLLRRYGIVFWRLLEREAAWLPPWRDLLRVYRRLEARGEIRGGRFVAGFSGEQFALPEAVGLLREIRRKPGSGEWLSLSGADPLNLVGILTPGAKLAALTPNRVLYRDGLPVALLAGGEVQFLEELDAATEWQARKALLRGAVPAALIPIA